MTAEVEPRTLAWRPAIRRGPSAPKGIRACFAAYLGTSALIAFTASCQTLGPPNLRVNAEEMPTVAALAYPKNAGLGKDLDIIVTRKGDTIELANRTALAYKNHYLWLNQEYVILVDQIKIGTENRCELGGFTDRHHETYPLGSLLTPDKTKPLISADLHNPATNTRHRLIVVDQRTNGR